MKVTLTRMTPDPVLAIEEAAANCYNSAPHPDGRIMDSCYESGHESVLEFCTFTWHIEGVSRTLSHQLVRSRLASFAQRSQRYCAEDGFEAIVPPSIGANEEALADYSKLMNEIQCIYSKLTLQHNIPAEDARFILPNACTTELEVSMNLREFIHFCNHRLCARAQWEIRQMCQLMVEPVVEQCPQFKRFLVPKCERNPDLAFCTERKSCGKHTTLKQIAYEVTNFEKIIHLNVGGYEDSNAN